MLPSAFRKESSVKLMPSCVKEMPGKATGHFPGNKGLPARRNGAGVKGMRASYASSAAYS